jgi:hypothetical protein
MYVMAAKALFYSAPKKETVQRAQKYVSRMRALWQSRQRLKSAAQGGIVALIALWGTAVSIFVIASVISIPLIVGQEGAKASYVQVSKGFIGGCAHPSGEYLCSKLYDQDKLVAEGFVIAASPDQVALYKDGTTSILDLKGRRLITEGLHLPNHKG